MLKAYICDPRRNTTCKHVCRVEGDTVCCMQMLCHTTHNAKSARRIFGIPIIDVAAMVKMARYKRKEAKRKDVQNETK